MALVPLNLFVTHNGKSKRQHITCVYKCGDACSKPVPNRSDNEYFGDIVKAVSRRSIPMRSTKKLFCSYCSMGFFAMNPWKWLSQMRYETNSSRVGNP